MPLLTIGLNHKTAPIDIRERVAFSPEHLPEVLHNLTSQPQVCEAAILSTCNRTEMMCFVEQDGSSIIIDWLRNYHELSVEELTPYLYVHPDQEAVRHMLRVASGLDSMILGEPQILGQIKNAYATAKQSGTVGKLLGKLFHHTFSVAKQIRTDTAIGSSSVSIAFATVSLAKQIFGSLADQTALLIGAGETIELAARHLKKNGIKHLIIANRTLARAEALVTEFQGAAITLGEIPDYLPEADIVISSTASQLPILGKGAAERAIKIRKHQPILMVDIAVPRDIEPQVGELDDVYLYTVDDLQEIIDEGMRSRQQAALQAEEIIDTQVHNFMSWLQSLDSVNVVCQYRERMEAIRDSEIERAKKMLDQGIAPEEVVKMMARTLTNKITHYPSAQMRRAGFEGRFEMIDVARELLGHEDNDD